MTQDERTGPHEEGRTANLGHHSHADGSTTPEGSARTEPAAGESADDFHAWTTRRCDELRAERQARLDAERRRREEHRAARRIGVDRRNAAKLARIAREEAAGQAGTAASWPQRDVIAEGPSWAQYGRWRR